jgi:deoxyribonuclease V
MDSLGAASYINRMAYPLRYPQIHVPQSEIDRAVTIQNELQKHVHIEDDFNTPLKIIAGVDVSYNIKNNLTHAFIVLIDAETLKPIADVVASKDTDFPYIPGFLSFREIPTILQALKNLPHDKQPDLLRVDGQGIAHPRRMGIAAHLGVLTDTPSIGVAKSRLTGSYTMPGSHKGDTSPLSYKKEIIGTVLRSRDNVKPLFVSPGHRVSVETSLHIVEKCLTKYRLPEPTRLADKLSKTKKP